MKKMNTPIQYQENPSRLIVSGPFRISRNPIYLSGVILLTGISLLLGSLITFIFPVLAFLLLNYLYIPTEEARLVKAFGSEYTAYKKKARRWLGEIK